jgi:hypothetical protein
MFAFNFQIRLRDHLSGPTLTRISSCWLRPTWVELPESFQLSQKMPTTNASIGTESERLFKNTIRAHKEVTDRLREYFDIDGEFAQSYLTGGESGKSDVIVAFTDGTRLSANVKAYSAGFNQLTRLTIAAFCKEFNLQHLRTTFETGAVRVAGKTGRFIASDDERKIRAAIEPLAKQIVHFSLARLENPELFVLFNRKTQTMHVFDMKRMLNDLDYSINISPRGIIKIGEFITIQRKGGNGVKFGHIEKTSLDHPGNNLQVKMKVGSVVDRLEPIVNYKV